MALIKCSECGRDISDKAANCPGCGAPVSLASTTGSGNATTEETFYVIINKETCGPYNLEKLNSLLTSGEISESTLFAQLGMPEWKPLSEIITKIRATGKTTNAPSPSSFAASAATPPSLQSPGRKCPFCGGEIPNEAVKCRHCGSSVTTINGPDKPQRSPIYIAVVSGCCVAGLGQLIVGQVGKGLVMMLVSVIVAVITGGIGAFVMWPLMAVDAYMVTKKINSGKPVGPWEFFPSS